MRNRDINKLMAAILALAFVAAPAFDSLACRDCQGDPITVRFKDSIPLPQAPALPHGEHDQSACPFCFLKIFGLIATPPGPIAFPSLYHHTPAVSHLFSFHPAPDAKPPRA